MANLFSYPDGKSVPIGSSQTMLDSLLAADIPHIHACGGNAYCSTCRVMILDGIKNCSSPTPAEKSLADKLQFPVHVRLACQTRVTGDVQIRRMLIDNDDLDLVDDQLLTGTGNTEVKIAVLMASTRGANNFDEVNFPVDIIYVMGKYFHRTRRLVETQGGKINNYMANWWMATFDTNTIDRAVERAVYAGLEILRSVEELNHLFKQLNYNPLQVRLAVHVGSAVIVPVDHKRPELVTPVGDVITQVGRLENAGRSLNAGLLVSAPVKQALGDRAVVGRSGVIEIW
ncbi:MAG: 2Fe-2S iron-sulfur cluster binding domain-containing protein [Cyanobacteria bacterium KgW148]|nr:2Fe-2S iron-sulfur cluster binding domain-containing protein [Cyanobacteria bacterium KgW148]